MKLVIWDLDETLWEGTIYYKDTVILKPETKEILKQIHKLGIIQCVCSQNRKAAAIKQLKDFKLLQYFTKIYAGVNEDKDVIIKKFIKAFNVSAKETLFIDDSSVLRALVNQKVGCHVDYETDLFNIMKYFDTDRLVLMQQQRKRKYEEKKFEGTFKDFLKTTNMEIKILTAKSSMVNRITNLVNRTNELNALRNRYTEEQIKKLINNSFYYIPVIYLKDKFGDYGLIGESIIKKTKNDWHIVDFCISCRTMGRGIGSILMEKLIKKAKEKKAIQIEGCVLDDKINYRMPKLYEKYGFKLYKTHKKMLYYILKLK